jgi:hypothetical protein
MNYTMTDKKDKANPKIWNSLEVLKLGASIATPLIVFVLGCLIWNVQRDVIQHWEHDQTEQRRQAEADMKERDQIRDFRLSIYKVAAPLLNDILTYHFYVGRWKETSPADLIEKKRHLDEVLYPHRVLFTPSFFTRYHTFMSQGFRSAGDNLGESSIRTGFQCRRPHLGNDPENWRPYFTNEDMRPGLCIAYANLLGSISEELLFQSLKMPASLDTKHLCPPFYDTERC